MVLKSMTGYGRAHVAESGLEIVAEILSVNRKHLDINIVLPRHLLRFDPSIRRFLSNAITRGHVTVRITSTFKDIAPLKMTPNIAFAKQLYQGWRKLAEALRCSPEIPLTIFEKESELFNVEETQEMELVLPVIMKAVEGALQPFLLMKVEEGKALESDILKRCEILKNCIDHVDSLAPQVSVKHHDKLVAKLKSLLPDINVLDERLVKECAYIAEKLDIAEEIVRFKSHLNQLVDTIKNGSESVGKTLEFLIQELVRESNTMGVKSLDIPITQKVIEMKSELERIKEQIQNVE